MSYFNNIINNTNMCSIKSSVNSTIGKSLTIPKTVGSGYFTRLSNQLATLRDSSRRTDEYATLLSMDDTIISLNDSIDNTTSDFVEIDKDYAEVLINKLSGCSLTNGDGLSFTFQTGDNGKSLFTSINETTDDRDLFVKYDSEIGKYYINNNLRSSGYYNPADHDTYSEPTDIVHAIMTISDYKDYDISGLHTIQEQMQYIAYWLTEDDSYLSDDDPLFELAEAIYAEIVNGSVDPEDGVLNLLQYCCIELHEQWIEEHRAYGAVGKLSTLVRDLCCSSELNDCILDSAESLISGYFDPASFSSRWQNRCGAVQRYVDNISKTYGRGGVLGAIGYILDLNSIFDPNDSHVNDDGVYEFTNNNEYIPKQYIAGVVTNFTGNAISIFGSIVSLIYPAVGMVANAVGQLVLAIPKLINYQYETQTVAMIEDSLEETTFPYCPIATFQNVISRTTAIAEIDDVLGVNVIGMIGDEMPVALLNVPGGALIIGKDSDPNKLRIEFHAGFINMADSLVDGEIIQVDGYNYVGIRSQAEPAPVITVDTIFQRYFNGSVIDIMNDEKLGVLSANDDAILRGTIIRNTYLFKLFMMMLSKGPGFSISYPSVGGRYFIPILCPDENDAPSLAAKDAWFNSYCRPILSFFYNPASTRSYTSEIQYLAYWLHHYGDWTFIAEGLGLNQDDDMYDYLQEGFVNICDSLDSGLPNHEIIGLSSLDYGVTDTFCELFNRRLPFADIVPINGSFRWGCALPKYNRSTFVFWTALTIAVTAVVAVTSAVVAVKVSKWRKAKRYQNQANMEQAWQKLVNDPSPENAIAYDKARKKNNRWASITGGTKYDSNGYWNNDISSTDLSDITGVYTDNVNSNIIYKVLTGIDM